MHWPHVWTSDEIVAMEEDGWRHEGWFHGLCRNDDGKLRLGEIFPGYGFTEVDWSDLRWPWIWSLRFALLDLFLFRPILTGEKAREAAERVRKIFDAEMERHRNVADGCTHEVREPLLRDRPQFGEICSRCGLWFTR